MNRLRRTLFPRTMISLHILPSVRCLLWKAVGLVSALLILSSCSVSQSSPQSSPHQPAAAGLTLYAAGSLQDALTQVAASFSRQYHLPVHTVFGPSGLLRARLEQGEQADVFASADIGNPTTLMQEGRSGPVVQFVRNHLCVVAAPGVTVTPQTLLDRMLDPTVKLGTSTPKADPAGDYAWEIFHKAETLRSGSFQLLSTKAQQLVGGPNSPKVPVGKNSLVYFMLETHQADLFLVYCSSGQAALRIAPTLHMVVLPDTLAVQAPYGLTVLTRAHPEAATLALYILSPIGQAVLAQDGFDAPLLPTSPSSGGTTGS